jgi:hypothetical protein
LRWRRLAAAQCRSTLHPAPCSPLVPPSPSLQDHSTGMFTVKAEGTGAQFARLRSVACGVEGCPKQLEQHRSVHALNDHLFAAHKLKVCEVCAESKRQFVAELVRGV